MKDKIIQGTFIEMPPRIHNTEKNLKRRWENAFQKWSNKSMQEATSYSHYYGVCGTSEICNYCTDNSYGRPCVRALNEMCRERKITIDYTKNNYEEIWEL